MIISILDFDDTIFPTTYCISTQQLFINENKPTPIIINPTLFGSIYELLSTVLNYSDHTYIVTNSNRDWLTFCLNILTNCQPLFGRINIVSTHDLGFVKSPDRHDWKRMTFANIFDDLLSDGKITLETPVTLVSMGDSHYDHDAANYITQIYKNVGLVSLKFRENPDQSLLIQEQEAAIILCKNIPIEKTHISYIL
jgi:hypothetical protein